MAIDFPASPTVGQTFTAGTITYTWDGTKWNASSFPSTFGLGTAASPSITFSGDTDTGLYSPGANQVAISTNGIERLLITAAGNIGIGVAAPSTKFHISGGFWATNGELAGGNTASTGTDGTFRLVSSGGTNFFQFGQNRSTGSAAPLVFGSIFGATEYMRITSAGLVGIGTSSPVAGSLLDVAGGAVVCNKFFWNRISSVETTATRGLLFTTDGTDYGRIYSPNGKSVAIQAGAGTLTDAITVEQSGRVGIGTTSAARSAILTAKSTNQTIASGNGQLSVITSDAQAADVGGSIVLGGQSSVADWVYASLSGRSENNSYAGYLAFATSSSGGFTSERARIDSSGRLLVGTSSARANFYNSTGTAQLQVEGSTQASSSISVTYNDNGVGGPVLTLNKSRSASVGGNTIVSSGDALGNIYFQGNDGTEFVEAALIRAEVDGTPGANDMPGRLVFSTTADGASSPTERMRIDSLGRVGIGTTSPGNPLHVSGTGVLCQLSSSNNNNVLLLKGNNTTNGAWLGTDNTDAFIVSNGASVTERLRVDSSGRLLVGTSSTFSSSGGIAYIQHSSDGLSVYATSIFDNHVLLLRSGRAGTAFSARFIDFKRDNDTSVGSITGTGSSVSYNTSSDYRLKENIAAVTDGITRLQQLKPSRFNFIADPTKTVDGFIAHEVQSVVPEAITGQKDAVDDDGNPIYQGIDQSKLVPLLTAALQEAIGEIELLKARVAALESA